MYLFDQIRMYKIKMNNNILKKKKNDYSKDITSWLKRLNNNQHTKGERTVGIEFMKKKKKKSCTVSTLNRYPNLHL